MSETLNPTPAQLELANDILRTVLEREASAADLATVAEMIANAETMQRHGIGGNQPPVLPERLIDVDALPALLDANYEPLKRRGEELRAGVQRWKTLNLLPRPTDWPEGKSWPETYGITTDEVNNRTGDFIVQLDRYVAKDRGEVDQARQRVKRAPWDACKQIDAWFGALTADILPDRALMDGAQARYLRKKADDARLAAEAEQRRLDEIAKQKLEEATAAGLTDDTVAEAVQAEEAAHTAARQAEAPRADLARSTSALGTTSTLKANWVPTLADKGAFLLAAAAPLLMRRLTKIPAIGGSPELQRLIEAELGIGAADTEVPLAWLIWDEGAVKKAVNGKDRRTAIPGITIEDDARAARRGRS